MSGVGKFLLSPVLALAGVFDKPKAPPPQAMARPAAQDRSGSVLAQAIASRRGTQDNKRTGTGGAEATGGKKSKLGT